MATNWVTRMWTVFVFAFLKFLSALGLKSSAAVPQQLTTRHQPATQPSHPSPTTLNGGACGAAVTRPSVPFIPAAAEPCPCELPYGLPYEEFLPPTIKQRIRAEAHGATPGSRRMSRGGAELPHADPIDTTATATIPAARQGTRPLGSSGGMSNQKGAAEAEAAAVEAAAGCC